VRRIFKENVRVRMEENTSGWDKTKRQYHGGWQRNLRGNNRKV
jgi:hypothetical protein